MKTTPPDVLTNESQIPTAAPWRHRIEPPPACGCPFPFVRGHEPACYLAPRRARFLEAMARPARAFGDQWAALWAIVLALALAEGTRVIGGNGGFILAFIVAMTAAQVFGCRWREIRAWWGDWRRGYRLEDLATLRAKAAACQPGRSILITPGEGRALHAAGALFEHLTTKPVDDSRAGT